MLDEHMIHPKGSSSVTDELSSEPTLSLIFRGSCAIYNITLVAGGMEELVHFIYWNGGDYY